MGVISITKRIKGPLLRVALIMSEEQAAFARNIAAALRRPAPAPVPVWFPEDQEPDALVGSTFPCDVAGAAPDGYRTLNTNPVALGIDAIQLALSNRNRKNFYVGNNGTAVVYLGFGFAPTSLVYTVALSACTASDDGTGGFVFNKEWKGEVWAIVGGGSSKVNFFENQGDRA